MKRLKTDNLAVKIQDQKITWKFNLENMHIFVGKFYFPM